MLFFLNMTKVMKLRNLLLIFVLSVSISFSSYAQITANFSSNKIKGCVPLTNVVFTDFSTSISGPITSRIWSLGEGAPITGNDSILTKTYSSPGCYDVSLIVSNGTDTDTLSIENYICVFEHPTPDFSTSSNEGCAPFTTNFLNESIEADAGISSLQWFFGNSFDSTTTGENILYTYNTPGDFTVCLTIIDSNGCGGPSEGTICKTDYIKVLDVPNAIIGTTGNPNSCETPHTVNFQNNSTGGPFTNYNWTFENGQSSNLQSPSIIFNDTGSYNVSLTVTNSAGCIDSVTNINYVNLGNVATDIFFSKDTLCNGESLSFSAINNGATNFSWVWDCCGTINGANGQINIPDSAEGIQYVTLFITGTGGCNDTLVDSIYVDKISADFITDPVYSCQSPFSLNLTDNSESVNNIDSWDWNLSSGDTSNLQNPSILVEQEGYLDVSLTVTNAIGCTDFVSKDSVLFIFDLKPSITKSETGGCAPLTVDFSGNVLGNNLDSVASWEWNFDDPNSGVSNTSSNQSETHVFNDSGIYFVTVTVTDVSGCTHEEVTSINVGIKQTADFSIFQDSVCAEENVLFQNLSTDTNIIDDYYWLFGDGTFGLFSSPGHMYVDTGYMTVSLFIGHNECRDSLIIDSAIYIISPVVIPTTTVNCDSSDKRTFTFTNLGADLWYWDFGDGSDIDSSQNEIITHTYQTGQYTAAIIGVDTNTGCIHENVIGTIVSNLSPVFNDPDPVVCLGLTESFSASSTTGATDYSWTFGSDTTIYKGPQAQYQFLDSGDYTVQLIVSDTNGCADTNQMNINVGFIDSFFGYDQVEGCADLLINFTDSSISQNGISSYSWIYGDGGTDTIQNPTYTFTNAGSYNPGLLITDSLGCTSFYSTPPVRVFATIFDFGPDHKNICLGDTVTFQNSSYSSSGNPLLFEWDFGDGNTSDLQSPSHVFTDSGFYNIQLVSINPVRGCIDSLTDTNGVIVEVAPNADFTASPTSTGCYPGFIQFTDESQSNFEINDWYWDFGDATFADSIQNPGHVYPNIGNYDVSLIAYTKGGCSDTIKKINLISINGPYAEFSFFPDTICKGGTITFVIDSLDNVSSYDWDFGNGKGAIDVTSDTITHIYDNVVGTVIPNLIFRSDTACEKAISEELFVHLVSADFELSDSILCSESSVISLSTNTTLNADSYQWFLEEGVTVFDSTQLTYEFSENGTYEVGLSISNIETGCIDTTYKNVYVGTIAGLMVSPDTSICFGDSIPLSAFAPAVTADSVFWFSETAYLSENSGLSTTSFNDSSYSVQIIVNDTNGCEFQDSINVQILGTFSAQFTSESLFDTTIILGESINYDVLVSPNVGYIYLWTPVEGLSCSDCPNPILTPSEDTEYTLLITDSLDCSNTEIFAKVEIITEVKATTPTAFTPNNDGENDIVYVKGWGIKELLEFNIYNRWGELVYSNPQDLNQGWDGTYKGKPQVMDTYAVTVKALGFNNKIVEYKGNINLIK